MNFKEEIKKTIKTRFISGVLVIVPLFVAIAVLKFVIESIDNFLKPYLVTILGKEYAFPLIGLVVTFILIILTGILTTNVLGQRLVKFWEHAILRIPLFKTVYSASKQLVEGFAVPEKRTFEKVVLIEYPRKGVYALGFLVNRFKVNMPDGEKKELFSVFVPSTPTPFTGIPILLPECEVTILNMSVEDGLKFAVSGSLSSPRELWISEQKSEMRRLPEETNYENRETGKQ
jgi:uncharacterized membrane protein